MAPVSVEQELYLLNYGLRELPAAGTVRTQRQQRVRPSVNPNYSFSEEPKTAHGGIDGEEFMGTGTAFDPNEQPPVYSPPH